MSNYHATILWERGSQIFSDNKYSREHHWKFSADDLSLDKPSYKTTVAASSSPHIVPLPYSVAENVDPEETFVASLSSCHMLFFLSFAAKKKWVIDTYEDKAIGILEKNEEGKLAMTRVKLNPKVKYSGTVPTEKEIDAVHHEAHEACFIANSVLTIIDINSTGHSL